MDIKIIEEHIRNLSDKHLVKMKAHPEEYTPEALAIAQDEIEKRGGILKLGEDTLEEILQDQKTVEKNHFNWALTLSFFPSLMTVFIVGFILEFFFEAVFSEVKVPISLQLPDWLREKAMFFFATLFISIFFLIMALWAKLISKYLPRQK